MDNSQNKYNIDYSIKESRYKNILLTLFDLPHCRRIYSKDTCVWLSNKENYYYREKKGHIHSDVYMNQGEPSNGGCVNKE